MPFINWLATIIAKVVADKTIALIKEYREKETRLTAIGGEAKNLMVELDNAQSEAEKKAILRKISSFSDLAKLRL